MAKELDGVVDNIMDAQRRKEKEHDKIKIGGIDAFRGTVYNGDNPEVHLTIQIEFPQALCRILEPYEGYDIEP